MLYGNYAVIKCYTKLTMLNIPIVNITLQVLFINTTSLFHLLFSLINCSKPHVINNVNKALQSHGFVVCHVTTVYNHVNRAHGPNSLVSYISNAVFIYNSLS